MENTSGGGSAAAVPVEIDRWNWGAFLLSWIWGIGNRTYLAFLALVPLLGLVMLFVLGARGSAWAWRNRRWESIEAFRRAQRKWALWGVAVMALMICLGVGLVFAVLATMKGSDAYRITVQALEASPEAVQVLGEPISTGTPSGSIQQSGPDGEAALSFSAEGPDGAGTVYVEATRSMGRWHIDRAVLEETATGRRVDLTE